MSAKERPKAMERSGFWRPWEAHEEGEKPFTLRGFRAPIITEPAPKKTRSKKKRRVLTLKEIQSPLLNV